MTNTNELTAKLKAAAVKASGSDWIKESGEGWDAICSSDDQANGGFIIAHFEGPDSAANREFVQAANPTNILALTEALEAAEKRIVALQGLRAQLCANADRDIAALRQRIASLEARTLTVKLPAHKYRECVNGLLEEAIAYAGTQQLRERLSSRLANFVQPDHPHARCAAAGIKLKIEGE